MQRQKARISPVILCGGSGTRLWPLSRESYPKQFVDLGTGHTLFQSTLLRLERLAGAGRPVILCNEEYRFYVGNEMRASQLEGQIILEPASRNTAPAIALAAFSLNRQNRDEPMLILPSDHYIDNAELFCAHVEEMLPEAERGQIITFGIRPTHPEGSFGYIRYADSAGPFNKVLEFIEKPDEQTIRGLLASGSCCWNSGIFLLRPSIYLEELRKFAPEIYASCEQAWAKADLNQDFCRPEKQAFLRCPENSIDYAIMEHTDKAIVRPMQLQWDDLGSWEAFYRYASKDASGNASQGEVILENVRNSYIRAGERLVAAIGLADVTIIETRDAVLVANRSETQKVKNIVAELKRRGSGKYKRHPLVFRPWGSYEVLASGDRFQVKRIVVNPGGALSLQMHHHRAEHWIIVSGTAEITNGDDVRLFTENQSTYIPVGTRHRLRNPGVLPLVMIEIQSGAYLGEDDIERFEDAYGR